MKPIREVGREERLERALLAIEGLCLQHDHYGDKDAEDNYILNDWGKMYSIAHAATGRCCTHINSLEMIERLEKDLKDAKIYDIEEVLRKPIRELEHCTNRDGVAVLPNGLPE